MLSFNISKSLLSIIIIISIVVVPVHTRFLFFVKYVSHISVCKLVNFDLKINHTYLNMHAVMKSTVLCFS